MRHRTAPIAGSLARPASRRRLTRLLAALILAVAGAVVGPIAAGAAPAHAATCSGANCVGVDPHAAGCSTASTTSAVFQSGSAIVTIENHYSTACNANWAVVYENSAALSAGHRVAFSIDTSWTTDFNGDPRLRPGKWCTADLPDGVMLLRMAGVVPECEAATG